MKKLRNTNVLFVAGLVSLVLIAGCGTAMPTSNSTPPQTSGIQSKTQLVMATSADYPPYEFHDLSSGTDQIKGFDVDIANQAAKDLGFTFTIKDITFAGLIGALQSGRADFVLAGMVPTPAREKNVDFSQIYYEFQNSIVVKKNSGITSLNQLEGRKIAAQTGTIQEAAAKKVKGSTVISLDTIPTIVQELETGRADGAIISSKVAIKYIQINSNLAMYPLPASTTSGNAVAFPKGSKWVAPFNQELQKMKDDGELNALIAKWFGKSQNK